MNNKFIEIYGTEEKKIINIKTIKSLEIYELHDERMKTKIVEVHMHFFGNKEGEVGFLEGDSYHSISYFFNRADELLLRLYTYKYLEIQIKGVFASDS